MQTLARTGSVLLIGVGVSGVVWSSGQLTHGVADIPNHWWSTIASAPLLAGALLSLIAWWRPRRRQAL